MSYSNKAQFDTLRSHSAAPGATYVALGSAFAYRAVCVTIKNATNGDVLVTTNSAEDELVFPAGSYSVYDIRTNAPKDTDLTFPIGLQFYCKDGATPSTTGSIYVEAVVIKEAP